MSDKANWVGTTEVDAGNAQHTGLHRFNSGTSGIVIVDETDATKSMSFTLSGVASGGTATIGPKASQVYTINANNSKAGTDAGWVVGAADNVALVTLPESKTGSDLVMYISGLKVGWIITGFYLIGQIEAAGNHATLDAALHVHTAVAADVSDSSLGAITQIDVIADTAVTATNSTKTLTSAHTILATETFFILIAGTTGAATDIALIGAGIIVSET